MSPGSIFFNKKYSFIYTILFSLLISSLIFIIFCDIRILNPTHTKWLMPGDSEAHWLNWLFYQQSPLFQIPLFQNYAYGEELSLTITLNDSIPLMAFIFKAFQNYICLLYTSDAADE